jgi:hypothetical protein
MVEDGDVADASAGTDAGDVADIGDADACGRYVEGGLFLSGNRDAAIARLDRVCCGSPTDVPGFSCVDLTIDGGQYGAPGRCLMLGETFDGKFAGMQCCAGLVAVPDFIATSGAGGFFR